MKKRNPIWDNTLNSMKRFNKPITLDAYLAALGGLPSWKDLSKEERDMVILEIPPELRPDINEE